VTFRSEDAQRAAEVPVPTRAAGATWNSPLPSSTWSVGLSFFFN